MRLTAYITLIILISAQSCQGQTTDLSQDDKPLVNENLYVSEHGQVELIQLNDTTWRTIFTNNDGFVFDTTMIKAQKTDQPSIFAIKGEQFFLKYHWGGLSVLKDRIYVLEISSYGMLGTQTDMWGMYNDPFFNLNETILLKGTVEGSKGLRSMEGVYFLDTDIKSGQYYELVGKITKEKWPSAYYSTAESPQGIFGHDTSKVHYRLVMKSPRDVTPELTEYKGNTINISTGEAAIAWEWADSEAYILDNHKPWTKSEELKPIRVRGILVQNSKGSFLKNWEIIE